MNEFLGTLVDGITRPLFYFINPAQRLFIPALLTSLLMAIGAYFYYQRKGRLGPAGFPQTIRNLVSEKE